MATPFDPLLDDLRRNPPAFRSYDWRAAQQQMDHAIASIDTMAKSLTALEVLGPAASTRSERLPVVEGIAEQRQMLKSLMEGNAIQTGQITAGRVAEIEARLMRQQARLDTMAAQGEANMPPPVTPGKPNVPTIRGKLLAALKLGTITALAASTAEAMLLRGQMPPAELVERISTPTGAGRTGKTYQGISGTPASASARTCPRWTAATIWSSGRLSSCSCNLAAAMEPRRPPASWKRSPTTGLPGGRACRPWPR